MGRPRKYKATGCQYHSNCDTCPYPDCLLDSGLSARKIKDKARALELYGQGFDRRQIAEKLGKSYRAIQRYLEEKVEEVPPW